MKKQKMSLEKMKTVLSNVLSRDEMKQVMAGSGPAECGACTRPGTGYIEICYETTSGFCSGCGTSCWW